MKPVYTFIVVIVFSGASVMPGKLFGQNLFTLDSLAKVKQACLDSGVRMPYCSYSYLKQMDSLLNLVYKGYQKLLSPAQRDLLRQEELRWLKKLKAVADTAYKEYEDNIKSGEWGPDMRIIRYGTEAAFIADRVRELIRRKESLQKNKK